MYLYKSKVDITPKKPVNLAGFAHRDSKMLGVKRPIYLRGFLLESNEKVLFISAEILFWGSEFVNKIKKEIVKKYDIKFENIFFSATHTHSGPMVSEYMLDELGILNDEYIMSLERKIYKLIDKILEDKREVSIKILKREYNFGVNRRLKTNNKIFMKPNFLESIDNDLYILKFINKENKNIELILINYPLHANTTDINYINGDFPGIIMEKLEQEFKESICIYIQGFTGDIRPKMILGEDFFRGSYRETELIANQIISKLLDDINLKKFDTLENIKLKVISEDITLDIDKGLQKEKNDFAKNNIKVYEKWLELIKSQNLNDKDYKLNITGLRINDKNLIITLSGEIVCDYGLFFKEKYKEINLIMSGYTNGMTGYIVTDKQLEEGGYESEEFFYYFGLPGKLSPGVEDKLKKSIDRIILKLLGDD